MTKLSLILSIFIIVPYLHASKGPHGNNNRNNAHFGIGLVAIAGASYLLYKYYYPSANEKNTANTDTTQKNTNIKNIKNLLEQPLHNSIKEDKQPLHIPNQKNKENIAENNTKNNSDPIPFKNIRLSHTIPLLQEPQKNTSRLDEIMKENLGTICGWQ